MPMSRRLAGMSVMSRPSTRTRPESSRSSPASERSAVVLPQPEGPSSATSSPGARSSERPSSALTSPKRRRSSTSCTRTPARDGLAPATAAGGARASGCRLIGPLTRTLARPLWSMNDSRNRSPVASSSAASETATATLALRLPSRLITTCRVSKFRSDEIVNSPSTRATEISAADMIAPMMLGTTIRQITPNQEQPRLRPASARVTRSSVPRPAASAR